MNISANKLKQYRTENGWSQEQLAELSGISLRTIQRAEKEGRCSHESAMAIASAFNVSPGELNEEFKNTIGDGTINFGGVLGSAMILSLILTIIIWEWHDLNVFINLSALLFHVVTVVSLSLMTCGTQSTFLALATLGWFFKQPTDAEGANRHLPILRRLIIYSYTSGLFWTATDIVEASYYAFNGNSSPDYAYEIGLSLTSMLYAILLSELILRPLKNRIEFLLMHTE